MQNSGSRVIERRPFVTCYSALPALLAVLIFVRLHQTGSAFGIMLGGARGRRRHRSAELPRVRARLAPGPARDDLRHALCGMPDGNGRAAFAPHRARRAVRGWRGWHEGDVVAEHRGSVGASGVDSRSRLGGLPNRVPGRVRCRCGTVGLLATPSAMSRSIRSRRGSSINVKASGSPVPMPGPSRGSALCTPAPRPRRSRCWSANARTERIPVPTDLTYHDHRSVDLCLSSVAAR
jgi:hypothetical protein